MPQGIIWVSSRISHPKEPREGVPPLTPKRFCAWYEDTHIFEVTALRGVPGAVRWEAVQPQPSKTTWSVHAPWLTIYSLPDTEYRHTQEFKSLDGQSKPKDSTLLHEIFEQARFDTRYYEELSSSGPPTASPTAAPSATLLLSWGADSLGEEVGKLESLEGVRRVRRFRVQAGTTLEGFVRRDAVGEGGVRGELVLVEFEEGALGRMREVVGGREGDEVGWFRMKRVYGEEDR